MNPQLLDQLPHAPRPLNSYLLGDLAPRLSLLPDLDRRIIELLLPGHTSLRQAAQLLGLDPGNFSRRVRRIRTRLNHPVLLALAQYRSHLKSPHLEIALARFAAGLPLESLARQHQMTRGEIRAILRLLETWAQTQSRPAAA